MLSILLNTFGEKRDMTRCVTCGKEIYMPFICNYCGEAFCSDHRLPENHKCPNLSSALPPHLHPQRPQPIAPQRRAAEYFSEPDSEIPPEAEIQRVYYDENGNEVVEYRIPMYLIEKPENPIWYFSALELKHLAIGILLMFGVGLSMFYSIYLWYNQTPNWAMIVLLAFFATLAFLLHEFGHKFVGIRLGNWSEFRLIKIFAIMTAISLIPIPFFKVVCPGAVQVTGDTSTENMGKIALAGPVVNLVQAAILIILALTLFKPGDDMYNALFIATFLNAFLGIFNLIPIGPLDGRKIIKWNKIYFFIAIIILFVMVVYAMPQISF